MAMIFSSKAGTLHQLFGCLRSARIVPMASFSVNEWRVAKAACLRGVVAKLSPGPWIVRSSCRREDAPTQSNAGAFLSLLDVGPMELVDAIESVIHSYGEVADGDEVLVQPMLKHVIRSGVAFSHDPHTCAPYRVINWLAGGDTTAVTGGCGGRTWQQAARSAVAPPAELAGVLDLLEELLALFGDEPLDCEFAVTRCPAGGAEELWLTQVRRLILNRSPQSPALQEQCLAAIRAKVENGIRPHPLLMGRRTVYGVMPDWNPAEIIGIRPKPLALSLYRELITDSIWAYQRHNYGYRNLRSFPLMLHFFGLPYIDVRLSFNSFIPADLNEGLANRLVDYYIDRLLSEPALHDKMEFEIVFSCYTLDLPQRLEPLSRVGFSRSEQAEIAEALRRLTNRIVHPERGLWREDAAKLERLRTRREQLSATELAPLEQIYWLLEDAKRYGTLPFAGLARAGFVAVQMLRSLVSSGVFSDTDYETFFTSISTVSGQLARDKARMDRSSFFKRYGHLRPGTYDILSPRYDEAPDLYFDWSRPHVAPEPAKPFALTPPQTRELASLLALHGLEIDPAGLLDFLKAGIEWRELAKFEFTRNLSDALALLGDLGKTWGFSRDDLAYCDIAAVKELHVAAADAVDVVSRSIEDGKQRYRETLALSLPPLIASPDDVWGFEWPETSANFVTQKQVTARVASCERRDELAGAVVCIVNADPGFDWLFAYPIAGLITAWGGANSHMAIRAGELGLPSVIGAGEVLFRRWASARRLHLDCVGRRVLVLE